VQLGIRFVALRAGEGSSVGSKPHWESFCSVIAVIKALVKDPTGVPDAVNGGLRFRVDKF
jgi:sugar/nucleoside kinase (ribokinase family)